MVEFLVLCVLVGGACSLVYDSGKKTGSRKGYYVGKIHGRRRRG